MRRLRAWMAPIALVAWTVAACDVKVQPPTTPTSSEKSVSKTPRPVKDAPSPDTASPGPRSPAPATSPGASTAPSAAPSDAASAAPSAGPGSTGLASPSAAPAAAAWIDTLEPLIAGPDGTVPKIAVWTATSAETGVAAYHEVKREVSGTGAVTVTANVTYAPDPPDVTVTLVAPAGSPGATVAAYELTYEYTTANQQRSGKPPIVIGPTRVPIAPTVIPAASDARPGAPLKLTVPIGSRALADVFQGEPGDVPGLVVASVEFQDEAGRPIPNMDLNTLRAYVPVRLLRGAAATAATPPAATPPAIPSFAPLVMTEDGTLVTALGLAGFVPAAGFGATVTRERRTDPSGAVFDETSVAFDPGHGEATIFLTAPPNGPGSAVSAYEIAYAYNTPAREGQGQPPIVVGPHLVPIPPKLVRAGAVTAFRVPILSLALEGIVAGASAADAPKLVKAEVEFKDTNGVPVPAPDLNPLRVTIPINVK